MMLTSIVAVLVYLGLAVLGWGGFGPFFAEPARSALVVVTIGLTIAALFTSGNLSAGVREDRGNRWVLAAFFILGLLLAFFPAYTDRHDEWTLGGTSVRWLGVLVYLAGGVLRLWPVFVLGRRFSGLVAIQTDHKLVTGGIYRHIRNPSYLGLIAGNFGWSLGFRSVVGILLSIAMLVPLVARMNAEERLLASEFGAEYEAYRQRSWRLVPGLY